MSSYGWLGTPTPTSGASIVVSPNVSTTYTVAGLTTSITGCPVLTNTAYVSLNVVSVAITASASKTVICKGKAVTLTAAGAGVSTYSWSTLTATTAAVTLTLTTNGSFTYTVYGTEPTMGCKSNSVAVTVSVSLCTGIAVNGIESGDINIFPNPATSGRSEIIGLSGMNTITVYNLLGQAGYKREN